MQVAKVISSKSMGMKGTRLSIINNKLPMIVDDFIEGRLQLTPNAENDDIASTWQGLISSQKKKIHQFWHTTLKDEEREALAGVFKHLDDLEGVDDDITFKYDYKLPMAQFKHLLDRMSSDMKRAPFLKIKSKGNYELHIKILNLFMMEEIREYLKQ